ncbi:MAG: RNA polymerase sigma factor RpoD [Candidatus Parcubacteria bacterium]|nr:MAG: RNA polymerase sigma factor RpoD [Candidatus Parcubacteria bacterium]
MRQLKISKQVTNRDTVSVEKYLQEISREELITAEEEVELARRIKMGDQEALDKLVRANLRFVISVAKQYQNQGLTLPDLINEGNLGLIKAAQRFDETRGFKFISYAVWWIRQSILQAIAEQARIVRLPLNKIGSLNKIMRTFQELEQQFEREPTPAEVAEILDIPEAEVVSIMKNYGKHVSIDAPVSNDEDSSTLLDLLPNHQDLDPAKEMHMESLRHDLNNLLSELSHREAEILRMFYGLNGYTPHSLEEIAMKFDLTRERVRQIKEKALRRIKYHAKCKKLRMYL